MPLYEYECDACGHRFEQIQKFSDPIVEVCPKCGERKVQKLLSSPAIQFKGSGWYITDYARKGDGAGADSAKPGESKDTKDAKETKETKDSKETKDTKETTDTKDSKSSSSESKGTSSGSSDTPKSTS